MSEKNTLWSLLKKYKWKSVFLKYALILFAFIILPLTLLTFFIFHQSNSFNTKHYIASQCKIYDEKIASQLLHIINTVQSTQNAFFQTPALQSYLGSDNLRSLDTASDVRQIYLYMQNTRMSSAYIDSIYLYNNRTNYVISDSTASFLNSFPDNSLFLNFSQSKKENRILCRTIHDTYAKNVLTFYTNAEMYGYPYAAIAYNISCERLPNELYSESEFINKIYISDSFGKILYSNDFSAVGESFSKYTNQANFHSGSAVSSYKIAFTYHDNDNYAKNYTAILIVYSLVTLLALSLSIYFLSHRFFQTFVDIINLLQSDGFEKEHSENEFQYLLKSIKSILSRNSSFETEYAMQYKKLKHNQTVALQSQINPHFIFNVMNTISLVDIKNNGEPTEVTKMIEALSDILRSLMNSDKYIISFERELSYVDKYLTLQNIKYNNKFRYKTEIDPDTLELPVVKFILQPIIENCIVHGILKLPEINGDILLRSFIKDGKMIIEVSNESTPVDEELLKKINEKLKNNVYPSDKHIGLLNVNNRIKLIFGEEYGCYIAYSDNITTVTITLPGSREI